MKYKTVVKAFVIAFFLFLLTVALGLKFNWVKYLKEKPAVEGQILAESQEVLGDMDTEDSSSTKKKISPIKVEIVSDEKVSGTTAEQVKNDCIRASRRAGVGDSGIHAAVRECVELSLQTRKGQISSTSDVNDGADFPIDSNRSLTRGACEMVVAAQKSLNSEEKERLVLQCIRENSQ